MHESKQNQANSKSQANSQSRDELQTEETFLHQEDSLMQQFSGLGDISNTNVQAQMLSRIPTSQIAANPQLMLQMQQQFGNSHVSQVVQMARENSRQTSQPPVIQAKLKIGAPGDKYEQEADRVAAKVVQQINRPAPVSKTQGEVVQGKEEGLRMKPMPAITELEAMPEDDDLQMKPMVQRREAIGGGEASRSLSGEINQARGGGQPLETGLQQSIGQAMGADFSGVRVHTDTQADRLNQSLSSRAFTTGRDLFFKKGEYQPGSRGGQELIAHELTHVVQQNGEERVKYKTSYLTTQKLESDRNRIQRRVLDIQNDDDIVRNAALSTRQRRFSVDEPLMHGDNRQHDIAILDGAGVQQSLSNIGDEPLHIIGHGRVVMDDPTVGFRATHIGGKTPEEVKDFLMLWQLPPDYSGLIYLQECYSGAGHDASFLEKLRQLLVAEEYRSFRIRGNTGSSSVNNDGSINVKDQDRAAAPWYYMVSKIKPLLMSTRNQTAGLRFGGDKETWKEAKESCIGEFENFMDPDRADGLKRTAFPSNPASRLADDTNTIETTATVPVPPRAAQGYNEFGDEHQSGLNNARNKILKKIERLNSRPDMMGTRYLIAKAKYERDIATPLYENLFDVVAEIEDLNVVIM